jgi:fatty-acyl-CoA synthase
VIGAVVILRAGAHADAEELRAHCRREIAAYKVPRLFHFATERDLPLTVTGKLQKNLLFTLFAEQRAANRQPGD